LGPGDRLVLYTDGISEATNEDGVLFGEERLLACVQALPVTANPEAITASLLREVEAHLGRLEAQDDRTLLVLRVHDAARVVAQASPTSEGVVVG
jgi:phosphoserine phosphatase RsbU/P